MIFIKSEYVHIKIDYPVSSKLFAQKPGLKNICLKYSLPSLLRSEDGLSGYLRSGERQKDFGKDLEKTLDRFYKPANFFDPPYS